MIIRPYAGLPRAYSPDVGEIVHARRTPVDKLTRAVVLGVQRNRSGALRVKLQWLEDNPDAGCGDRRYHKPITAGSLGWIDIIDGAPPLIKQIDRDTPPAAV